LFPFLLAVFVLTVALPEATKFFFSQGWISEVPSFLYQSTWLMAFITTVIYLYLYRSRNESHFVQLYLLSMVVKLIACLAFIVLIVLEHRQRAVANAMYFVVVYAVFTATEIGFLYRQISASRRR
jgi:hypothetical protein